MYTGLKLHAVALDIPSTYVCRIFKTQPCFFPTTIEMFAHDMGMLLDLTSQVKQLICSTVEHLKADKPVVNSTHGTATNEPKLLLPCPISPKKAFKIFSYFFFLIPLFLSTCIFLSQFIHTFVLHPFVMMYALVYIY